MNREIEEKIIKKYVKKNKQERILWEINNPKKRMHSAEKEYKNQKLFCKKWSKILVSIYKVCYNSNRM